MEGGGLAVPTWHKKRCSKGGCVDTSSKSALRWGFRNAKFCGRTLPIVWVKGGQRGGGQKSRKFCDVLNGSHIDFYPSLMETNTTIAGS